MAKKTQTNDVLVPISYWAVGRVAESSEVAIKLNDLPAILMSMEVAKEIAAALISEADAIGQPRPRTPSVSASARAARPAAKW